ncbi:MAG: hypothetical protein H3C30_03420 [Candidatus Hydrogenedentes bacterium]|nr:hypothetical protein [Candidatus Hydrogenedentota bacterium]
MASLDLTQLSWTVEGWRPHCWRLGKSMETGFALGADIAPVPVSLPGTVQRALLEAGLLPDWHVGANSRRCEWVEHRHWILETTLPEGLARPGEPVVLEAEGLDYSGWILVDMVEAGRFEGALLPHRIDLGGALSDGKPHRLSIVFAEPPREQGQFGHTSLSRHFKPRFNYSWDWCPRFVPVGVWGQLRLLTGAAARVSLRRVTADWDPDRVVGRVSALLDGAEHAARWSLRLLDGDRTLATLGACGESADLEIPGVSPWQPNGFGEPKTYTVEITAWDEAGGECLLERRSVGFRRVEWRPCADAPAGALPWICTVNGTPVFLQGANWTPVKVNYQDAVAADYEHRVGLYRDMGCTVLRVWGGAMLESTAFYEACDRAGILVWQEFPLSSSGIENAPPDDPGAIDTLRRIAVSYVRRRAHHPSLLLWCGGNELYYGPSPDIPGPQKPIDTAHPCIAMLAEVVAEEDPARRFLPGSPSGPVDYALKENYGRGIHHDVHGPWGQGAAPDMDAWREYWAADDALFRSEVGYPGAADAELIRKYAGDMCFWPPQGEYWMHTAAWWTLWGGRVKETLAGLEPGDAFQKYVELTQALQAEAYAVAAVACKARFPRCGGFIIWMGHDCFPCPSNNSVIDFGGRVKPAWQALRRVFLGE